MQNFDFLVSYTDCSLVLKRVWTREFRWVTGQCYSPASTLVSSFDPGFVSSFKGFSHTRPLLFLMPSPSLPLLLCNLARNLLVTCGTKKKKKKNLYLHLLVYYKGYNSGTAKWKEIHKARQEAFSVLLSQYLCELTNLGLQTSILGTLWRLHYACIIKSLAIDD